jgi:hypothetical protein
MKIEINYNPQERNYSWEVYDGPDGIDHAQGTELSLGGCFEKIVEFRLMNGLTYAEDYVDLKRTITAYFNSLNQK